MEGEKIQFKFISLSISKFYKFYNILSQCLPIFNDNNVRSRSITPKFNDFDLCPICLENQPNMLLDCNVKNIVVIIAFILYKMYQDMVFPKAEELSNV